MEFEKKSDPLPRRSLARSRHSASSENGSLYQRLFSAERWSVADQQQLRRVAEAVYPAQNTYGSSGMPAGYTYFGQLIAHDLTFMSPDGARIYNRRTPDLRFDSIIGPGSRPAAGQVANLHEAPSLCPIGRMKEDASLAGDLPRDANGLALTADERADDVLPLAQFNTLFLQFLNALERHFRKQGMGSVESEQHAREEFVLHAQQAVWFDYLARICDPAILAKARDREPVVVCDRRDAAGNFMLPIEFAAAIFRFGHAQAQPFYGRWNGDRNGSLDAFFNLSARCGRHPMIMQTKKWATLWHRLLPFEGYDGDVLTARPIGPSINRDFAEMPQMAFRTAGPASLAHRTLESSAELSLCDGTSALQEANMRLVARNLHPLPSIEMSGFSGTMSEALRPLEGRIPLWIYILEEARQLGKGGRHLGPLGSLLVVETVKRAIRSRSPNIFDTPIRADVVRQRNGATTALTDIVEFSTAIDPFRRSPAPTLQPA